MLNYSNLTKPQYTVDNAGLMFVVDVITDGFEHATNIFDNLKTAQRRFRNPPLPERSHEQLQPFRPSSQFKTIQLARQGFIC